MKKKAFAYAITAALAMAALGGCAAAPAQDAAETGGATNDYAVEQEAQTAESTEPLTEQAAIETAISEAGFTPEQATNVSAHKEMDDGIEVYDVTFYVDGVEYEYSVSADNATIIEAEQG